MKADVLRDQLGLCFTQTGYNPNKEVTENVHPLDMAEGSVLRLSYLPLHMMQYPKPPSSCFMNLLGATSYPGQVLNLCVRSDAGIAFLLAVLHIAQVKHTGNDVQ